MKNHLKKLFRNKKGLALSELMVATAIFSLVTLAVTNVYVNGQQSYFFLEGSAENMQESRYAIDQLSRDLRSTVQITSASGTSITFTADPDGDGDTDTVTYTRTNGNLTRQVNTTTKTLATGIVNATDGSQPIFKYYDQNGVLVTDGTQAKLIEMDLRIDKNSQKSPLRSTQITTRIQLRNLHERR